MTASEDKRIRLTGGQGLLRSITPYKLLAYGIFEGGISWTQSKPAGQPRRCHDVSHAEQMFGFAVRTAFTDGLRATFERYETTATERLS